MNWSNFWDRVAILGFALLLGLGFRCRSPTTSWSMVCKIIIKVLKKGPCFILILHRKDPPAWCINHVSMRFGQATIKALHKLPFWDSMVWAWSKKVPQSLPGLMELLTFILWDTSNSSPNVIGFSAGEILLQKFLLNKWQNLVLRIEPMFDSFLEGERKEMHP
jgi:hypothetical protein